VRHGFGLDAVGATDQPKLLSLSIGDRDAVMSRSSRYFWTCSKRAVIKMLRNNIGRPPVVSRQDPHHLVGYLGRSALMAARLRRLEEEHVREPGWLRRVFMGTRSGSGNS